MAKSPYVQKVSDLLSRLGSERRVEFEAALPLELTQARVAGPASIHVRLEGASDRVLSSGSVSAPVEFRCNRCLTTWTESASVPFQAHFERGSEDSYPLEDGDIVDLEPVVRDELALAMPLVPLCRPECAGLCPICGIDLNVDRCPGHESTEGSPFAALQQLLDQD